MSLTGLMNLPCTVFRTSDGAIDDYGDPVEVTDAGTATVCELQKQPGIRTGREEQDLALASSRWVIYLPAGTQISARDYVMVGDDRYDLDDDPDVVRNPRTRQVSHVECRARRTD
jgi:hypothetical protein